MSDVRHTPTLTDNGPECEKCGIEIPLEVAALGDDVIEIGAAGVHWVPQFAHDGRSVPCTKNKKTGTALLLCPACAGAGTDDGCETCGNTGFVTSKGDTISVKAAKPQGREVIERAPKKSEFEKQMQRQSQANFLAMREATRPTS